MVGMTGLVRSPLAPHGTVQINGELWSAEPVKDEKYLPIGARVHVVQVEGFTLRVRYQENEKVNDC